MASNPQQQQSSSMSSAPTSPFVWFLLLDSATGKPYKGTTADAVSLPPGSFVVQFRDAVKAKHSNKLSSLDSADLLVYQNKAAFDKRIAVAGEEREEPLEEDSLVYGLGTSKKEALFVVVPSSTSSPELYQLEQEIKALENSEEYKSLAYKNRAWAVPKPTEQEKGEWQLLKEKLADLKKKEDFYQNAILSTNVHSVKKSDKTRKGYKKDTAIKDERLLLSDVAITMWERFGYTLEHNGKPTFGDFKRAAGFNNDGDVRDYFRKKAKGEVKEDDIKESFTQEVWIWLIGLDLRVNTVLRDTLITNEDGRLRLLLEYDVYEDATGMAECVIRTLYGPEKTG